MGASTGERTFTLSELLRGYKLWHNPKDFRTFEDYLLSQGYTDDTRIISRPEALDILKGFNPDSERRIKFETSRTHEALSHGKPDLKSLEY